MTADSDTPSTSADPGAAWHANAARVAQWYLDNLVVRVDRYGYHKAKSRAVSSAPLTLAVATAHVHARTRADVIGGLTVVEVDGVCYSKETALDIDAHDATPEQTIANEAAAITWYTVLVNLGYDPLLTTEGGGGYHLRAIHKQLQEARKLQALGRWLCADWAARGVCPGATGTGPEVYPKQYKLRGKRCGNWLRWPAKHHKRDAWTRVWDGTQWLEGQTAIDYMLNLKVTETPHLPPDINQYLQPPVRTRRGTKRRRKATCATYTWPDTISDSRRRESDMPPAGRVVGKLLGGQSPSDEEFLGTDPDTRAVAKYLSRVASVPDRYCMLIAYPVAVVDPNYISSASYTGGVGVVPPPGYKWVPPADPDRIAVVDRILDALPAPAHEPEWAPTPPTVVTQSGTPTWTKAIPAATRTGRGRVDFDRAAQTFDLATYLGLGATGGKVLCPAHGDTRPSMSVYHAHGRWHYRCWACGVHGDSIAYLAHTNNISRYEAARRILSKGTRLPKVAVPSNQVARPPAYTNPAWQFAASEIIDYAHSALTSASGREARAYLRSRGIDDATVVAYRLGWNHRTVMLDDVEDFPQGLIIPRGITIPWLLPCRDYVDRYDPNTDSPVYAGFNVRLLGYPSLSDPPTTRNGDPAPKYISAQGSTRIYPYPYSALRLPGHPLLVLEGEFDAMLANRLLGDRFNVATWCSAASNPVGIHVPDEFRTVPWYLLMDNDPAGQKAAQRWLVYKPDAIILAYPDNCKDFTELYQSWCIDDWITSNFN